MIALPLEAFCNVYWWLFSAGERRRTKCELPEPARSCVLKKKIRWLWHYSRDILFPAFFLFFSILFLKLHPEIINWGFGAFQKLQLCAKATTLCWLFFPVFCVFFFSLLFLFIRLKFPQNRGELIYQMLSIIALHRFGSDTLCPSAGDLTLPLLLVLLHCAVGSFCEALFSLSLSQTQDHVSRDRSTSHFHWWVAWILGRDLSGAGSWKSGGGTKGSQQTSCSRPFDGIRLCFEISDAKATHGIILSAITASTRRAGQSRTQLILFQYTGFFVFTLKNSDMCWQKRTGSFNVLSLPLCFDAVAAVFEMLSQFASFYCKSPD